MHKERPRNKMKIRLAVKAMPGSEMYSTSMHSQFNNADEKTKDEYTF